MNARLGVVASEGGADIALVSSIVVLLGGRLVFGKEAPEFADSLFGGLGAPTFAALVLSAAPGVVALARSRPLGGAVCALVAAIGFFTLAFDPILGSHGNGWFAVLGTAFRVHRSHSHQSASLG